jgi:putative tryptophan/tyrosine transport system substrate-binding protein
VDGGNLQIETRWAEGYPVAIRRHAEQLRVLPPDVIVVTGNAAMEPLLLAAPTVPIVFNQVVDPVGAGYIESLAQPGGNITGFLQFEYSLSGKWLELLKEVAPHVRRVAVLRDPTISAGIGQFAVIQALAPSTGVARLRRRGDRVNRRDLIILLGGTAASPLPHRQGSALHASGRATASYKKRCRAPISAG